MMMILSNCAETAHPYQLFSSINKIKAQEEEGLRSKVEFSCIWMWKPPWQSLGSQLCTSPLSGIYSFPN